ALMASTYTLEAGRATWNLNPSDNNWNKAESWTPATIPYGEDDVATFGVSNATDIILGATQHGDAANIVASIVFEQGASAYRFTVTPVYGEDAAISFHGTGVINTSGVTQNLVTANSDPEIADSARIYFLESHRPVRT